MIDWFKGIFTTKERLPSLKESYWRHEIGLVREVGSYSEVSIGGLYDGLYARNRHTGSRVKKHQLGYEGYWYRNNLVVF